MIKSVLQAKTKVNISRENMGTVSPARAQRQTTCSGTSTLTMKLSLLDSMCRSVKKQSAPILVNAGVEGNMEQQQQPSW